MGFCKKISHFYIAIFSIAYLWLNLLTPSYTYAQAGLEVSEQINWSQLQPDLLHASATFSQGLLSTVYVDLIKTSLTTFEMRILRAQRYGKKVATAKELCSLSGASVCINGSFFDEQRKALGLLIERGITVQKIQNSSSLLSGVIQSSVDGVSIIHREKFEPKKVLDALQAGPRLVESGSLIEGLRLNDVSERRSGVCIDNNNNLIFFIVRSSVFGISTSALQKLLIKPGIDCKDALNLDGGSSSQLFYQNSSKILDFPGLEPIPVAIGLVEKQPSTK
jgi:uncharacterized protein YigE (DUF2233 family)